MIRGERVTLRPTMKSDVETLRRWHDDPEVMRYWGEAMPLVSEGQFEDGFGPDGRFTKFERAGHFIICDEAMRPIGRIGFHEYSPENRHAELGIFIGEKDCWSKGYGSEAIVAFGHWYFNVKGAHRLWLNVFADNVRAQRAYEKIGFTREGTWREQSYIDGRWMDEYLYGLLRPEFNARYRPDLSDTAL